MSSGPRGSGGFQAEGASLYVSLPLVLLLVLLVLLVVLLVLLMLPVLPVLLVMPVYLLLVHLPPVLLLLVKDEVLAWPQLSPGPKHS